MNHIDSGVFIKNIVNHNMVNTKKISLFLLCVGLILITCDYLPDIPSFCIHRLIFGFDCPGCGITRALHSLLNLHFSAAFDFNFAVYVLIFIFAIEIYLGFSYSEKFNFVKKIIYNLFYFILMVNYVYKFINFIKT